MHKDIKDMVEKLEAQGWRLERRSKHIMAFSPDKTVKPITIPLTPSDHRSIKNVRALLRRGGADL